MTFGDPRSPRSLSYKMRSRRDVALRSLIENISVQKGGVKIIDLGGSLDYWRRVGFKFLQRNRGAITLVNLDPTELTADDTPENLFESRQADACNLSEFDDASFDLAHSNSVIEHVGSWSNMKAFAKELRRVGESYYVQTPYFWFPIDPHFYALPMFHWMPHSMRLKLLNRLALAHAGKIASVDMANEVIEHTRLLDTSQFDFLFPDATLKFERFIGLPKSMIATRISHGLSKISR